MSKRLALAALVALAACNGKGNKKAVVSHVLLISVDGMHELDLARVIARAPSSTLAQLAGHGVHYRKAVGSLPSDSFPGLLALVTGGSPRTTGVWYDDSFDRKLYAPGSNCTGTAGAEVLYDESIDLDSTKIDGGGGINVAALPMQKTAAGCTPVYPHSFLRVNTVFEVVKAAGLRTAWADKHLAYDLVRGPSGKGVDDLYTPEIAANNATKAVSTTEAYDDLKVQAVINWIDGMDSSGKSSAGVPAIFGMNFQAVSVGQKLATGGYADATGTPSASLQDAINHTDAALGKIVAELNAKGLADSTLIIITAKHGQSPVDRTLRRAVDDGQFQTALAANLGNGRFQTDDVGLFWFQDQSAANVSSAVSKLQAIATPAGFDQGTIYSGAPLISLLADPSNDSRAPDIAIQPNRGVIYTHGSKIAEHGGFSDDDTHVAILVSHPALPAANVDTSVMTTQVAPTIVRALGLDANDLQAVKAEKTDVLPSLIW